MSEEQVVVNLVDLTGPDHELNKLLRNKFRSKKLIPFSYSNFRKIHTINFRNWKRRFFPSCFAICKSLDCILVLDLLVQNIYVYSLSTKKFKTIIPFVPCKPCSYWANIKIQVVEQQDNQVYIIVLFSDYYHLEMHKLFLIHTKIDNKDCYAAPVVWKIQNDYASNPGKISMLCIPNRDFSSLEEEFVILVSLCSPNYNVSLSCYSFNSGKLLACPSTSHIMTDNPYFQFLGISDYTNLIFYMKNSIVFVDQRMNIIQRVQNQDLEVVKNVLFESNAKVFIFVYDYQIKVFKYFNNSFYNVGLCYLKERITAISQCTVYNESNGELLLLKNNKLYTFK